MVVPVRGVGLVTRVLSKPAAERREPAWARNDNTIASTGAHADVADRDEVDATDRVLDGKRHDRADDEREDAEADICEALSVGVGSGGPLPEPHRHVNPRRWPRTF